LSRKQLFLFAKINLLCVPFFRVTTERVLFCAVWVPVHPEGNGKRTQKQPENDKNAIE